MGRTIYEIKLNNRYYPATSAEDVLEMVDPDTAQLLTGMSFTVSEVVNEEHTMKLLIAAKTLCEAELFESDEIEAAIRAMAIELGYYNTYADVTDCVLTWADRFTDMSVSELQEWIIG